MQKSGEKYSWSEGILNAPAFGKGKESPLSWANLTVACNYFNLKLIPFEIWDLRFEIGTEWLFMGVD